MTEIVGEGVVVLRADDRRLTADAAASGKTAGSRFSSGFLATTAKIGAGIAAAASAKFLVAAIGKASDLNETVSKTNVIFGRAAADVLKFSRTTDTAFGQSQQQALDAASTFGIFGKAAGLTGGRLAKFSTDFTGLASDLASFNNTSPEEAIEAIGAALRGEAEPIRRYGILLDDASLKAEAMKLGLADAGDATLEVRAAQIAAEKAQRAYNQAVEASGKHSLDARDANVKLAAANDKLKTATKGSIATLTPQQRILAAQSLIYKQTGDAQGDFARTSQGLANQQRILSATFDNIQTKVGKIFLPIVLKVVQAVNSKVLPVIDKWVSGNGDAGDSLAGFGSAVKPLLPDLEKIGRAFIDAGNTLPSFTDLLNLTAVVLGFLADHTDLVIKLLPALAAGYLAVKAAQLAANIAATLSVPVKIAEVIVNRQLVASNRELIASRAGLTTQTVAQTASEQAGLLTRIRATVSMVAQRVATVAVSAATKAYTVAQWLLNAALTANPIGIVVIAIAALVAALVIAYTKSETFRNIVTAAFNAVGKAAAKVFGFLRGAVTAVVDFIRSHWKLLLVILTGPIGIATALIIRNWGRIKGAFTAGINFIRNVATAGFNAVRNAISSGMNAAENVVKNATNGIKNAITTGVSNVVSEVGKLPGKIGQLASDFLKAGLDLGEKVVSGITDGLSGIGGAALDFADSIRNAINDLLHLPFHISGPGPLPDIDIPAFARGTGPGGAPGGFALVGEQGPELAWLPPGTRVWDNDDTTKALGGTGRPAPTIHVHLPTGDPMAAASAVAARWVLDGVLVGG